MSWWRVSFAMLRHAQVGAQRRSKLTASRSPEQVTKRMDALIADIREKYHKPAIGKPKGQAEPCDVLIVAHGHILRAFAGRWVGDNIASNPHLVLEAGGVGTLRSVSTVLIHERRANLNAVTSIIVWTNLPSCLGAPSCRMWWKMQSKKTNRRDGKRAL